MADPAKFKGGSPGGALASFTEGVDALTNALNPFSEESKQKGQIPFYNTGARAFIKVGGRPIAVCQDFRWSCNYQGQPTMTVDTVIPWDIDVGPLTVNATLTQVIDPTKSAETDALFSIMKASVHQPMVELQVLDKLGTSLFFSRGMFLAVSGGVARGQVSNMTAQFTGIMYQHYSAQQFTPYDSPTSTLSGLVSGLAGLASTVSGGIL